MEIVRRSALKVVGLPVHATWEQRWIDMPAAWKEFFARCENIPHRGGDSFIFRAQNYLHHRHEGPLHAIASA